MNPSKTIRLCTKAIVYSFILAVAALVPPATARTTAFYFTSSPQSWVGQGQTRLVTPADDFQFFASQNAYNGVSLYIHGPGPPWEIFGLDFNGPNRLPLQVGSYPNAIRYPSYPPTFPGLDFTADGRGDNTLTGFFTILEIHYGPGNSIFSFAADFTQYDEGHVDWWNSGSIRFHSSLPIPEPSTLSLFGIAGIAAFLSWRCRNRDCRFRFHRFRVGSGIN